MNTEDFKLECAECYLTDECDAMYGGMNPPCTEVALQSVSDNTAMLQLLFDMKMFLLAGVDCKENVDNLLKRIDGEIAQLQQ